MPDGPRAQSASPRQSKADSPRPAPRRIIGGAYWIAVPRIVDSRGALTVFEGGQLPFDLRRMFFIEAGPGAVRGEHASGTEELLVAITGGVTCELDTGADRITLRLVPGSGEGLWLRPGVWLRLRDFAPGTVLAVGASLSYADTRHFDTPQPSLIEEPT